MLKPVLPFFSVANETIKVNVTVENCLFGKADSSKHSKIMFESDEFTSVKYK